VPHNAHEFGPDTDLVRTRTEATLTPGSTIFIPSTCMQILAAGHQPYYRSTPKQRANTFKVKGHGHTSSLTGLQDKPTEASD